MRVLSWASWLFAVYIGVTSATSDASGVVEVDIVFPRNDTYAPSPWMPIVFGIQNTKLAPLLDIEISFNIWNLTNGSATDEEGNFNKGGFHSSHDDPRWVNMSSADPYLSYRHYDQFNTEGSWLLVWTVYWSNCTDHSPSSGKRGFVNAQTSNIAFTTKKSAQGIDLVTATNNKDCSEDRGMTFNIADTYEAHTGSETCAAMANSTVTPSPCRVKIDDAAASSISESLTERLCTRPNPEISCPAKESAAQRLLVGCVACLMATFGVLGYMLL
jgi:hypothetical protein